ncbi:hypothetical protein M0R04_15220 [Candidatus Dojkabacteria bacterium]|jgi:hypothetical protein|nr:hypothetical protein [Candidatus Dojkabacteria bacterium]
MAKYEVVGTNKIDFPFVVCKAKYFAPEILSFHRTYDSANFICNTLNTYVPPAPTPQNCQRCGGKPIIRKNGSGNYTWYYISCHRSSDDREVCLSGPVCNTPEKATEEWNKMRFEKC